MSFRGNAVSGTSPDGSPATSRRSVETWHHQQRDGRRQRQAADHGEGQRPLQLRARRRGRAPAAAARTACRTSSSGSAAGGCGRRARSPPRTVRLARADCSEKSSSMMPFFTTRPISRIRPIADETFRSVPVSHSSSSAPPSDNGAAEQDQDRRQPARGTGLTRMANTSTTAMPNTISSSRNAWRCDSYCPPIS